MWTDRRTKVYDVVYSRLVTTFPCACAQIVTIAIKGKTFPSKRITRNYAVGINESLE